MRMTEEINEAKTALEGLQREIQELISNWDNSDNVKAVVDNFYSTVTSVCTAVMNSIFATTTIKIGQRPVIDLLAGTDENDGSQDKTLQEFLNDILSGAFEGKTDDHPAVIELLKAYRVKSLGDKVYQIVPPGLIVESQVIWSNTANERLGIANEVSAADKAKPTPTTMKKERPVSNFYAETNSLVHRLKNPSRLEATLQAIDNGLSDMFEITKKSTTQMLRPDFLDTANSIKNMLNICNAVDATTGPRIGVGIVDQEECDLILNRKDIKNKSLITLAEFIEKYELPEFEYTLVSEVYLSKTKVLLIGEQRGYLVLPGENDVLTALPPDVLTMDAAVRYTGAGSRRTPQEFSEVCNTNETLGSWRIAMQQVGNAVAAETVSLIDQLVDDSQKLGYKVLAYKAGTEPSLPKGAENIDLLEYLQQTKAPLGTTSINFERRLVIGKLFTLFKSGVNEMILLLPSAGEFSRYGIPVAGRDLELSDIAKPDDSLYVPKPMVHRIAPANRLRSALESVNHSTEKTPPVSEPAVFESNEQVVTNFFKDQIARAINEPGIQFQVSNANFCFYMQLVEHLKKLQEASLDHARDAMLVCTPIRFVVITGLDGIRNSTLQKVAAQVHACYSGAFSQAAGELKEFLDKASDMYPDAGVINKLYIDSRVERRNSGVHVRMIYVHLQN